MVAESQLSASGIAFSARLADARAEAIRGGDCSSLGELLQLYRHYLQVIASTQLDARLRRRVGTSDLVQETMLFAHRDFKQFRGSSEGELLSWLRSVLGNVLSHAIEKHLYAQKRDLRREVTIDRADPNRNESSAGLSHWLVDRAPSPSEVIEGRECAAQLSEKLNELKPRDRDVIIYRSLQGMSFDEIANKLGMRTASTRMLWIRAIAKFKALCDSDNTKAPS
ncbi:MAG: sigma-70 family RNA polymerase sigma factor [Planctomycetota bacterium]